MSENEGGEKVREDGRDERYIAERIHVGRRSLEAYSYPTFPAGAASNLSLASRREVASPDRRLRRLYFFHQLRERPGREVCRAADPSCKFSSPRFIEFARCSGPLLPLSPAISSSRFLPLPFPPLERREIPFESEREFGRVRALFDTGIG